MSTAKEEWTDSDFFWAERVVLNRGKTEGGKGPGRSHHYALLLSYVRPTASEFDLIFLRKEIKRK